MKKTKGSKSIEKVLKPEALLNILEDLEETKKRLEKSQKELILANELKKKIIEKSPFGIYLVNEKGIVEYANPEMCKISGIPKEKFEGINTLTLPTYKKLGISKKIKEGLKGKSFFIGPVHYTSYFGKKRTIRNFTGIPIKEKGINKLLVIVEDITKRKEAEEELMESEKFVKNILEHAGIPILAFSKKGNLLIANKELLDMTGYKKEEINTREKWFKLAFPSKLARDKISEALSWFYKGKEVNNFVIPIMCKNKSTVIVVSNITGIKDKKEYVSGEVIFMRDLGEMFNLEEQIRYWAANGFIQTMNGIPLDIMKSKIELSKPIKELILRSKRKKKEKR